MQRAKLSKTYRRLSGVRGGGGVALSRYKFLIVPPVASPLVSPSPLITTCSIISSP